MISITLIITVVTVIISLISLGNNQVTETFIFYPPAVTEKKQYYRFITYGFIHADLFHLIFNMYSFYSFSNGLVEPKFISYFGDYGRAAYLIMYLMALVISLLPTYFKNKDNTRYTSLGASGAVSAVIFAGIIIWPTMPLYVYFIPIPIPGFVVGILFLVISAYLDKRGGGNINHSAHMWGALFGAAFIIISAKLYASVDLLTDFVEAIKIYMTKF
ncbi:MAG: rhomboid family intramembrane serine protease [Ginsengibacter sp.]